MSEELQEVIAHAKRLVQEQPRHNEESLFAALDNAFPEVDYPDLTQEHIEAAIKEAL